MIYTYHDFIEEVIATSIIGHAIDIDITPIGMVYIA